MLQLGDPAPTFTLPEVTDGSTVTLDDLGDADALLVVFLCRHCPYVKHVEHALVRLASDLAPRLATVSIAPNDPSTHPEDAPDSLAAQKREVGFAFPYLYDESQEVARAYGAACTPDPFLFDGDRRLVYRGRLDATRPGMGVASADELRAAAEAVLAGSAVPGDQYPPMGCSIKWRPGNAPAA